MPMSDYIRDLRSKIGTTLLQVPTVSVLTFDEQQRVLLGLHVEGRRWTTPGGMVEPLETPAEAALREMWEETGLFVELTHIVGVFGGPACSVTYSNGDRMAFISTVFGARVLRGTPKPDGEEILELRYFSHEQALALPCTPHVAQCLEAAAGFKGAAAFQTSDWQPLRS
jgi:ADP-ribose pyrophosphatase YjhB (NUDIX family)